MKYSALRHRLHTVIRRAMGRKSATFFKVEKAELAFCIQYFPFAMVSFDVSANIGKLSLLFSRFVTPSRQVQAYEAWSDNFKQLCAITGLTKRKNVQLNHLAVSDRVGTGKLRVDDSGHASRSTLAVGTLENYIINFCPLHVKDVEMTTIDLCCETHYIPRIDLLKIDVEGAVYHVIAGCGA